MTALWIIVACITAYALFRGLRKLKEVLSIINQGEPEAPEGVAVIRDVEFKQTDSDPLLLDIYLPEGNDKPLPVLMYIFGGGWVTGNKHQLAWYNLQNLAQHGFAVVSISYRWSSVAKFPAQIHDCKAALRWIRKNAEQYNLNPHRIGVIGASAGGHLASLMGTSGNAADLEGELQPGEAAFAGPVQATVNFFGLSDMSQIEDQRQRLRNVIGPRSYNRRDSIVSLLFGGSPANMPNQVQKANPVAYVEAGMPPFLHIHGAKDRIVPLGQSELLHDALLTAGNDTELHVVEKAGHLSFSHYQTEEIFNKVKSFCERHLK